MQSKIASLQTPPPQQGFLGPGHVARAVIQKSFTESDPFIMLMDDDLVVPEGNPVGGPHPHAGFETVTLILDSNETHVGFRTGDFEMMTAGSGIIHTESIDPGTRVHLLQLWLTLSKENRWTTPRVQKLNLDTVPKMKKDGVEIRVYSGSLAGLSSPVLNHVPVTIADIHLDAHAKTTLSLPANRRTFLYVIDGSVSIGSQMINAAQVGWLDDSSVDGESTVTLTAGNNQSRVVVYSGEPTGDDIVSYGPFIGDKQRDIIRLYEEYHEGKMKHVNILPQERVYSY
jgi:redox-sensitive bicupin YhaK (pirin superfamily)